MLSARTTFSRRDGIARELHRRNDWKVLTAVDQQPRFRDGHDSGDGFQYWSRKPIRRALRESKPNRSAERTPLQSQFQCTRDGELPSGVFRGNRQRHRFSVRHQPWNRLRDVYTSARSVRLVVSTGNSQFNGCLYRDRFLHCVLESSQIVTANFQDRDSRWRGKKTTDSTLEGSRETVVAD